MSGHQAQAQAPAGLAGRPAAAPGAGEPEQHSDHGEGGSNASLTMRRTNRLGGMVLTRRFVGRVRRRARSSTTTTPTAPPAASTLIRQASGRRVAAASAAVRAAGWAVATPANAVAARAHSLSSPATRRHRPADLFLLLVGGAGRDPRIRIQDFEFIMRI